MDLLDNAIQPYAWGSRSFLAELQGRASPSPGPEAELWLGAHPAAPSRVARDGERRTLLACIDDAPERELGLAVVKRFGPRLPFLLKVLAADEPLSLQVHPDAAQAKDGFARENAAGVALDDPARGYKDDRHKPELVVALTELEALSGFRPVDRTLALLDALAVPALADAAADLRRAPDARGLRAVFERALRLERGASTQRIDAIARACEEHRGPFEHECAWVRRLALRYPSDPGVVGALLLDHVRLGPGEGLFLPAGHVHAYLRGAAVEIMASSDNVLRCGLTTKHVDVEELLRIARFEPAEAAVLRPREVARGAATWDAPAEEFALARVDLDGAFTYDGRGPAVVLCTDGALTATASGSLALSKGSAAFVAADDGRYTLEGRGRAYVATVPA